MITYLLYMNEELKHFFTPGPMVSFKRSRKISSYLVRAKFYPVERSVGSFNCKRPHCQFCAYDNETENLTSAGTGENYKINHRFYSMEKCLIYLLTCNKCRKQYLGQTVDPFRYRRSNYRSNYRKHVYGICKQEHLYEHFWDSEHSEDLLTRPTLPNLSKRKSLEAYLEDICIIRHKHKRKCVAFSLLILISFAWIGIICVVISALTLVACSC